MINNLDGWEYITLNDENENQYKITFLKGEFYQAQKMNIYSEQTFIYRTSDALSEVFDY